MPSNIKVTTVEPVALSPTEAAKYIGGVDVRTLNNWRSQNVGPDYARLNGKRIVYPVAALDAFIAESTVEL